MGLPGATTWAQKAWCRATLKRGKVLAGKPEHENAGVKTKPPSSASQNVGSRFMGKQTND